MNQPEENPYASPQKDVSKEASSAKQTRINTQFSIQGKKVVGESPLSLPEVCFYCADDVVGKNGKRDCAEFVRANSAEPGKSILYQVYYSTCSACLANADDLRGFRKIPLVSLLGLIPLGAFVGILTLLISTLHPDTPEANAIICFELSLIMIGIGCLAAIFFCEWKLPKRPSLSRNSGATIELKNAGVKFLERFRERV
ncbi:hypothetical protein [Blastopirellula marina]|uniref:Uncharacterized protein n=1 Tax=Blastopirellula marina TaxID=124 RepID=A0A2S8GIH7_9BACT|nr:hypothetical protein [Blastopirellula marina]PQO44131.1 hypothetical protein C5Y93_21585 [Blastopirellula marina]